MSRRRLLSPQRPVETSERTTSEIYTKQLRRNWNLTRHNGACQFILLFSLLTVVFPLHYAEPSFDAPFCLYPYFPYLPYRILLEDFKVKKSPAFTRECCASAINRLPSENATGLSGFAARDSNRAR